MQRIDSNYLSTRPLTSEERTTLKLSLFSPARVVTKTHSKNTAVLHPIGSVVMLSKHPPDNAIRYEENEQNIILIHVNDVIETRTNW